MLDSSGNFQVIGVSFRRVNHSFLLNFLVKYIIPQCMGSNALEKSINSGIASRFFVRTRSMVRYIVGICDVKQFLRKPFRFFLRIFSISCWIRLRKRTKCYASGVHSDFKIALLGEEKEATPGPFLYYVYRWRYVIAEVSCQILLSSKLLGYFIVVCIFLFLIFCLFQYCVKFFLSILFKFYVLLDIN